MRADSSLSRFFAIYGRSRMIVILCLGFSSGLPLALTASTLFAWLADVGVDRTTIGIFAAIAMPYSLKFLWSPVLDGMRFPVLCARFGRRRGWLLATQCALIAAICGMGLIDPLASAGLFGLAAFAVAFFSASQDVVIDAYRVEILPPEEQGAAAAMYTFGYRIAMLVSGAGALMLSDHASWQTTYLVSSAFMGIGILTTLLMTEPQHSSKVVAPDGIAEWIRHSVIAPFADFMTRDGWLAIIIFVVLYRLADAYLGVMFNPFLLDLGFTKTQIAEVVKLYGLIATILGGFFGGWLVMRMGIYRTLVVTTVLHMMTNLLLVVQADLGAHKEFLILCVTSENLTSGMGSVAFVAYLSSLCRINYTATQYALLSSLAAVARTMISTASGQTAEWLGWQGFFLFSSLLALPALAMLILIRKRFGESPTKPS